MYWTGTCYTWWWRYFQGIFIWLDYSDVKNFKKTSPLSYRHQWYNDCSDTVKKKKWAKWYLTNWQKIYTNQTLYKRACLSFSQDNGFNICQLSHSTKSKPVNLRGITDIIDELLPQFCFFRSTNVSEVRKPNLNFMILFNWRCDFI